VIWCTFCQTVMMMMMMLMLMLVTADNQIPDVEAVNKQVLHV